MPIKTYADLKLSISQWAKRTDINDVVDSFIDLAESDMWQKLCIRDMEARAQANVDAQYLALPQGYLIMRKLRLINGATSCELVQSPPESITVHSSPGIPRVYSITSQVEFDRPPLGSLTAEMHYYRALDSLSSANQSNAILARFPMIYLYGALKYFADWSQDDNKLLKYSTMFDSAISDANKRDKKGRYGAAPAMRVEGSTP